MGIDWLLYQCLNTTCKTHKPMSVW